MNFRLLSRLLGILSLLIGVFMLLSLIWATERFGVHTDTRITGPEFERAGFWGLLSSSVISFCIGGILWFAGKSDDNGKIYRKEAMAVVGLSWVLATVLGALPYVLSGTARGPSIRVFEEANEVFVVAPRLNFWQSWLAVPDLSKQQVELLSVVSKAGAKGLTGTELQTAFGSSNAEELFWGLVAREELQRWLLVPGEDVRAPSDRASRYRLRWVSMGLIDSMFESQSGFSTTGATVLCDLEDPHLVPRCILFWRASTHFLGGLGIIVLFVVLLGQGSAGKALMRTEMPGPTHDKTSSRMQHTAWLFAGIYVGLNFVLATILYLMGMTPFDSLCHAFATMATGGFSTYNASLGHFARNLPEVNGQLIEYVVILFMILAGTNFTLLFFAFVGNPLKLFKDQEWQTYVGIIAVVTGLIVFFGYRYADQDFDTFEKAFRYGAFQVVSIITTTGYGTSDFDSWNQFNRCLLLCLMFVGGCAGSTGGGMKVIRHLLFVKILGLEIEQAFRPKVVGVLKLGGKPVEDKSLRHSILVYFGLIFILFVCSLLFITMTEPDSTWGVDNRMKLVDSSSAVISTLNNIGPGLGNVGATQNYSNFSFLNKAVFIWLMMLGRLEIFPILVLFAPGFWRDH